MSDTAYIGLWAANNRKNAVWQRCCDIKIYNVVRYFHEELNL